MSQIEWCSLVFLTGLTFFGVFGSVLELVVGEKLSFAPPFLGEDRYWLFALAPVLAGPMMLLNDALDSYRDGYVSYIALAGCCIVSLLWTSAMGVAMLGIVGF